MHRSDCTEAGTLMTETCNRRNGSAVSTRHRSLERKAVNDHTLHVEATFFKLIRHRQRLWHQIRHARGVQCTRAEPLASVQLIHVEEEFLHTGAITETKAI
jgi:hypothetical protein